MGYGPWTTKKAHNMLKSYFKIAWRSVSRYKSYSIINILGLALGIASCLLIFLVVRNELSYDNFHNKADRTYRVTMNALDFNPSVSMAIAPALQSDFPELENVSQFWFQPEGMFKVGENRYNEKAFAYADDQFLKIFDYQWIAGNPNSVLSEPNAVVITESIAKKYFGKKEAMGQVINLDNAVDLKVSGLIKDLPGNTHLPFNFLISFETILLKDCRNKCRHLLRSTGEKKSQQKQNYRSSHLRISISISGICIVR
jgi:hypothetical protein